MSTPSNAHREGRGEGRLPEAPPFIWPEARFHAGIASYESMPPGREALADGDLLSGVVVGAEDGTIEWLTDLLSDGRARRVFFVLVLHPAGPTRERHLRALRDMQRDHPEAKTTIEIRLLPMAHIVGHGCARVVSPPTIIQVHDTKSGKTTTTVGSVGDAGRDPVLAGSVNLVFHPDEGHRDEWRRWFQYIWSTAVPLCEATLHVPELEPAKGDPAAAEMWEAYANQCLVLEGAGAPVVDSATGEVIEDEPGRPTQAWDQGHTALDDVARSMSQAYASGWLVTVDEVTRIKPLSVPVKATLLGQSAERSVGSVKQRQSFTLQVLDAAVEKAVEASRRVSDLLELLSYPLSQGNRWIPEACRNLLEGELEARNERGKEALRTHLGTSSVEAYITSRKEGIRRDLDSLYRELGQQGSVPDDRLEAVLGDIAARLNAALDTRITPRVNYNRIAPPNLTMAAPDESWSQPLALLLHAARSLRESLVDAYFPRKLKGVGFSDDELRVAHDAFGDGIVPDPSSRRAKAELALLEEIEASDVPLREKCGRVLLLIRGEQ